MDKPLGKLFCSRKVTVAHNVVHLPFLVYCPTLSSIAKEKDMV
jgi:hypothetical protein